MDRMNDLEVSVDKVHHAADDVGNVLLRIPANINNLS